MISVHHQPPYEMIVNTAAAAKVEKKNLEAPQTANA
jgi:hypothetical protein